MFLEVPKVPNTNRPLPIECPKCEHVGGVLVVKSITVMTVTCARCQYVWATDLPSLPPDIQEQVRAVDHQRFIPPSA